MELVEEDAGLGSMGLGRGSKRLPHVHDSHSNTLAFPGPQPLEELVHARLGAILAAKPDGPPSYQVTHDDPVGVPLPDRDLVDADHFRSWRPALVGAAPACYCFTWVERLGTVCAVRGDATPEQRSVDRRGSAEMTTDVEAKALGVERIVREASPASPASPCRSAHNRQRRISRSRQTLGTCRMTRVSYPASLPIVEAREWSPCLKHTPHEVAFFERRCSVGTERERSGHRTRSRRDSAVRPKAGEAIRVLEASLRCRRDLAMPKP